MDAKINSLRHALSKHLCPKLPVYDLFAVAGTCRALRLVVAGADEGAWKQSAQQTFSQPHPALTAASVSTCMRELVRVHNNLLEGQTATWPAKSTFGTGAAGADSAMSRDLTLLATAGQAPLRVVLTRVRGPAVHSCAAVPAVLSADQPCAADV